MGDSGRPWAFVLLGVTGSGKSSLGNVLMDREVFKVGHTARSCTFATNKQLGLIPSLDVPLVVIDTPGYGDSGGRDEQHMREIQEVLAVEQFVNAFLLVLNSASIRCDDQIFNMLQVITPNRLSLSLTLVHLAFALIFVLGIHCDVWDWFLQKHDSSSYTLGNVEKSLQQANEK